MTIASISFKSKSSFVPVSSLGGKEIFINKDKIIFFEENNDGNSTNIVLEGNNIKNIKGTPEDNMQLINYDNGNENGNRINTVI